MVKGATPQIDSYLKRKSTSVSKPIVNNENRYNPLKVILGPKADTKE
jgi:hypothetical protein